MIQFCPWGLFGLQKQGFNIFLFMTPMMCSNETVRLVTGWPELEILKVSSTKFS